MPPKARILSLLGAQSLLFCGVGEGAQVTLSADINPFLESSDFSLVPTDVNFRFAQLVAPAGTNNSTHILLDGLVPVEDGSAILTSSYRGVDINDGTEYDLGQVYLELPAPPSGDGSSSPIVGIVARAGGWDGFTTAPTAGALAGATGTATFDDADDTGQMAFDLDAGGTNYTGSADYTIIDATTIAVDAFTLTDGSNPVMVSAFELVEWGGEWYSVLLTDAADYDGLMYEIRLAGNLWGGYPTQVVGAGLWADARSDWLGWITVHNEPIVYIYGFDTFAYLTEPAPGANGAWVYFFKKASEDYTPVTGNDTWGGYPTSTGGDGNTWADARLPGYQDPNAGTANWVGWMMVNKEPYINFYNAHLTAPDGPVQVWVYMTEPDPNATGAWGYVFKRQGS